MIVCNFLYLFTWKSRCGLKFHFRQFDRRDFHFTWSLVNVYNEVTLHWNKICHTLKSPTGLSSLWVSCKHALIIEMQQKSKLNKSELHSANINNRLYSFFKDLIKLKRLHESNINLHNRSIIRGLEFLLCFTVIKVKIMAVRTILLTVKTNNKKII